MSIPTLQTDRLLLRPLVSEDAEDLFSYAQDEAVARPGMWEPYSSYTECSDHLNHLIGLYSKGLMWWGIFHKEDQRLIGRVELANWDRDDARADLSYALSRDYWGKGLMTEAAAAVVDYGWGVLKLHRLEATVLPDNLASIRLLEQLGMRREGTLIHYRKLWSEWVDVDIYGMIRIEKSL